MIDFSIKLYEALLESLSLKYEFQSFKSFLMSPLGKTIILRNDVDAKKGNSLIFAKIQSRMGISGTYYFRIVKESFSERIIKTIANLGHEIGYHYEDMDLMDGNIDLAYDSFRRNLDMLRKISPIETICMHGSPRSKYDNRDIWKKYNFRKLGIIGEPYIDLDFNNVLYLTDTGRKWNGSGVSVRDKVNSGFNFNIQSTHNLISSINLFPDKVMITFHPQRWTNNYYLWFKELIFQNIKNIIKKSLFVN